MIDCIRFALPDRSPQSRDIEAAQPENANARDYSHDFSHLFFGHDFHPLFAERKSGLVVCVMPVKCTYW